MANPSTWDRTSRSSCIPSTKHWRDISAFDLRHNFVASYRYELPFEKLFGDKRIATGWALTGITRFSTGVPVTLIDLNDYALIGTNNQGANGGGADMPNFAPGNLTINHDPANGHPYFNTSLFNIAPSGSEGNSPRRFFYGPGNDNWDMALLKVTHLTESKVLEIRSLPNLGSDSPRDFDLCLEMCWNAGMYLARYACTFLSVNPIQQNEYQRACAHDDPKGKALKKRANPYAS